MLKKIGEYQLKILDKSLMERKKDEILELLKLIPNSHYTLEDILGEKKGERVLYGKWEYSLVLLDKERVVGVLIGYEREKEESKLYSENCFYINEVAISRELKGKGLGRSLLRYFIDNLKCYKYLDGDFIIRIQTTNRVENIKVIELYEELGFEKVGTKDYPTKQDLILEIRR